MTPITNGTDVAQATFLKMMASMVDWKSEKVTINRKTIQQCLDQLSVLQLPTELRSSLTSLGTALKEEKDEGKINDRLRAINGQMFGLSWKAPDITFE